MQRGHLYIKGRVQGVGFRHFTKTIAREAGVNGWVKNLPDGRVEAVFEGPKDRIKEIIKRCKSGPGTSRVDNVRVEWEEPTGEFNSFTVNHF